MDDKLNYLLKYVEDLIKHVGTIEGSILDIKEKVEKLESLRERIVFVEKDVSYLNDKIKNHDRWIEDRNKLKENHNFQLIITILGWVITLIVVLLK